MDSRLDAEYLMVQSSGMAMPALGKQLMTLGGTLLVIGAILYYGSPVLRAVYLGTLPLSVPGFHFTSQSSLV
jgi:hypothetical protein